VADYKLDDAKKTRWVEPSDQVKPNATVIKEEEFDGLLTEHIPALEISSQAANKIRKAVSGKKVIMQATNEVANFNNTVEVDFWYATSLDLGLKLSNEFGALAKSFSTDHNKKTLFTPRIATYACTHCSKELKDRNCLGDGRYCSFEPRFLDTFNKGRNNTDLALTGRDILL